MKTTEFFESIRHVVGESGDAAIELAGASAFGAAWPLVKPFATTVRRRFGPSPADDLLEEQLRRWEQGQQDHAERRELVALILNATHQDNPGLSARMAKAFVIGEIDERARRSVQRARAHLVISLGRLLSPLVGGGSASLGRIERDLALLGFSDQLVATMMRILSTRDFDLETLGALLVDLRTALSCQFHPALRMVFEAAVGARTPSQRVFFAASEAVARELGTDVLMSHALHHLGSLTANADEDRTITHLRAFADMLLEFT